ncbi:MAG: ribonuclease III, partial [Bacteroidia bacterium]|nr:ribonuclease III [Bacteroidia bacterium]
MGLFRIIGNSFSTDRKLNKELKQVLGFYPHNLSVYKLAFQHKSAATELHQGLRLSNERLEFLGDAVLSSIISDVLYKKFPYKEEGFLTEMRSKIVSRKNLKRLAKALQLENFIVHNVSGTVYDSIYGDAVEALIGAVYIDRGYKKADTFVRNRIINYHIDIDELEFKEENFKGKLLNWAQKEKHNVVFQFIDEDED